MLLLLKKENFYLCGDKLNENIMAVAGIKVERTSNGVPKFATIDLQKHTEFIHILKEKGVKMDREIKWTAKMKRSFEQAKNGEIYEVDMNNFWKI